MTRHDGSDHVRRPSAAGTRTIVGDNLTQAIVLPLPVLAPRQLLTCVWHGAPGICNTSSGLGVFFFRLGCCESASADSSETCAQHAGSSDPLPLSGRPECQIWDMMFKLFTTSTGHLFGHRLQAALYYASAIFNDFCMRETHTTSTGVYQVVYHAQQHKNPGYPTVE